MASSNKTPNYNLPQYAEDDTIEFTPEINTAFSTIDTELKKNADNVGLLGYMWSDGSTLSVPEAVEKILPVLPTDCIVNARWTNSQTIWSLRIARHPNGMALVEGQRDLELWLFRRSTTGVWTEKAF